MDIFSGSSEIQMLCWSVLLGLFQLASATMLATRDQGVAFNIGPRDAPAPAVGVLAGRMQRAFANFRETFVYFAVAVLMVSTMVENNPMSALGAQIYFWARVVYIPAYALGLTGLRSIIWGASLAGILMVFSAMLNLGV